LFIQSTLQCRDFRCCEAVYDAFFEGVLDVPAAVLIAWPAPLLVGVVDGDEGVLREHANRLHVRRHGCCYDVVSMGRRFAEVEAWWL
jgi:hypothetical protein